MLIMSLATDRVETNLSHGRSVEILRGGGRGEEYQMSEQYTLTGIRLLSLLK